MCICVITDKMLVIEMSPAWYTRNTKFAFHTRSMKKRRRPTFSIKNYFKYSTYLVDMN